MGDVNFNDKIDNNRGAVVGQASGFTPNAVSIIGSTVWMDYLSTQRL